jgi:rhomboid protease GluP
MFQRQRSGSVVCPSCGRLVGVKDEKCLNCGRRNPGLWGFAAAFRGVGNDLGFTRLVIGACIVLYGICVILSFRRTGSFGGASLFSLLPVDGEVLFAFGASGSYPVFGYGRWWTVLSAGWLHGGLLHILFNMMWVKDLMPQTAELYGASRTVIVYTISSITGFALSTLAGFLPLGGADLTVGASAPIFGLLGALVYYSRRAGSRHLGSQVWGYAIALFVFGFLMPSIDNWAHFGGFAGGWLAGRVLDPLRTERVDHTIAALACLGLTALSIAASLITAL